MNSISFGIVELNANAIIIHVCFIDTYICWAYEFDKIQTLFKVSRCDLCVKVCQLLYSIFAESYIKNKFNLYSLLLVITDQ